MKGTQRHVELLEAALGYCRRGLRVLPLHTPAEGGGCSCRQDACVLKRSVGKHPRIGDWTNQATADEAQIRKWWATWPDANIGILTGAESGVVVLDIDDGHVDGVRGSDTLAGLEERHGKLPSTIEFLTGGGGRHILFKHPGGYIKGKVALLPGIDIRGDGSQIVAPPSLHASGRRYEVEASSDLQGDFPEVPAWLETMLRKASEGTGPSTRRGEQASERIEAGSRNSSLAQLAGAMRRRGSAQEAIEAALLLENQKRCVPPLSDDEVLAIARSISKYPSERQKAKQKREQDRPPESVTPDAGGPALNVIRMPKRGARATGEAAARRGSGRPDIELANRQLDALVAQTWDVVLATNELERGRPFLFVRSDGLVRLHAVGDVPKIRPLNVTSLVGRLARIADWTRTTKDGEVQEAFPDHHVAADMLEYPSDELPGLDGVITAPTFSRGGELIMEPGYHPEERVWYHDTGLRIRPLPESVEEAEVHAARTLLFDDLLVDFQFEKESDRAHAVAALVLPFMRRLFTGNTPLHGIIAPSPGSGKGLLSDVISITVVGGEAATITFTNDEDETRKRITSLLSEAPTLVVIDNISDQHGLDSAQLASAVTSRRWKDRPFRENTKTIELPNLATWLFNGNNPKTSLEIARRSVRCRIDPKSDRPWKRTGPRPGQKFKHPNLRQWTHEHRAELVRAILVIIRWWLQNGRPPGTAVLGSFEEWSQCVGGVLYCAGIDGFLGDMEEFYETADKEGAVWRPFVGAWWGAHGNEDVSASDLLKICKAQGLLADVIGEKSEASQRSKLGFALGAMKDRQFGRYAIRIPDRLDRLSGCRVYCLEHMAEEGADAGAVVPAP